MDNLAGPAGFPNRRYWRRRAEALARMFKATAFLPGQRGGVDVASYMDIELVAR